MKTIFKALLLVVLLLSVNSCAPKELEINLYTEEGVLFQTLTTLTDSSIDLPITYTAQDTVYVGWETIEGTLYSGSVIFDENLSLYLVEEQADDVFVIEDRLYPQLHSNQMYVYIHEYTGESQYLRIPEMISGKPVKGIVENAFLNSNFIEVFIPNTVNKIEEYAFANNLSLTYVEFYGTDVSLVEEDVIETMIDGIELNEILEENPTTCTIAQDLNDIKIYGDRCPVIQSEYIETRTLGD